MVWLRNFYYFRRYQEESTDVPLKDPFMPKNIEKWRKMDADIEAVIEFVKTELASILDEG